MFEFKDVSNPFILFTLFIRTIPDSFTFSVLDRFFPSRYTMGGTRMVTFGRCVYTHIRNLIYIGILLSTVRKIKNFR